MDRTSSSSNSTSCSSNHICSRCNRTILRPREARCSQCRIMALSRILQARIIRFRMSNIRECRHSLKVVNVSSNLLMVFKWFRNGRNWAETLINTKYSIIHILTYFFYPLSSLATPTNLTTLHPTFNGAIKRSGDYSTATKQLHRQLIPGSPTSTAVANAWIFHIIDTLLVGIAAAPAPAPLLRPIPAARHLL